MVRRLRSLAQETPDLKEAAQVYEIVLPLLREADLRVAPLELTRDQACEKMKAGRPLLQDEELGLDAEAARALLIKLARALEQSPPAGTGKRRQQTRRYGLASESTSIKAGVPKADSRAARLRAAQQIRRALENELEMSTLLPRVAAGDIRFVAGVAQSCELDSGLLWTLAQNALKPALRAWAQQLAPMAAGIEWRKGYCFICGSGATLGELQGNTQIKHLRCGQCGSDWTINRVQCMYCGNENHNTYGYLYPDGQREKMRLEVCDNCKGYLKVITAFDPTAPELVPIEDLATLPLDYIAQEQGYTRVPFT